MENNKADVYTAILELDTTPVVKYIKKVEQLIAKLERVRNLLREIAELNPKSS